MPSFNYEDILHIPADWQKEVEPFLKNPKLTRNPEQNKIVTLVQDLTRANKTGGILEGGIQVLRLPCQHLEASAVTQLITALKAMGLQVDYGKAREFVYDSLTIFNPNGERPDPELLHRCLKRYFGMAEDQQKAFASKVANRKIWLSTTGPTISPLPASTVTPPVHAEPPNLQMLFEEACEKKQHLSKLRAEGKATAEIMRQAEDAVLATEGALAKYLGIEHWLIEVVPRAAPNAHDTLKIMPAVSGVIVEIPGPLVTPEGLLSHPELLAHEGDIAVAGILEKVRTTPVPPSPKGGMPTGKPGGPPLPSDPILYPPPPPPSYPPPPIASDPPPLPRTHGNVTKAEQSTEGMLSWVNKLSKETKIALIGATIVVVLGAAYGYLEWKARQAKNNNPEKTASPQR